VTDTAPIAPELLDEIEDLGRAIAQGTARILGEAFGQPRERVSTKSSATDMVSEVDREAEAFVTRALAESRPDDGLLGEEGASRPSTSGVRWVVDPLDGTTNFLFGIPAFSVSLAAQWQGETVFGVVIDPGRREEWRAARGRGAYLNDEPCQVAAGRSDLSTALIGTGFNYDARRRTQQAELLQTLIAEVRDIRRFGSAALDLCWVAGGRLDGYYEWGLNEWDKAAGELICREAGGKVSLLPGGTVVAATPELLDELCHLLEKAGETGSGS
jgi:myo-inositol-1(or 4)-monophosphatase